MRFDLPAYLARIGLDSVSAPTAASLALLQGAHRQAIAFENLDIPLGRGVSLDPDTVFDKLVTRRRGGYCFEQNQLLLRALRATGFDARPLLARVWLSVDAPPPRTHTLNLVRIDDQDWIADAGFGGSFVPPIPLAEGPPVTTPDGTSHRLRRDPDHGWMLERRGSALLTDGRGPASGDWHRQYSFTLEQVMPADLEMGNHWASTHPDTRLVKLTVVSIAGPAGFASLVDRALTVAGTTTRQDSIASAAAYRETLAREFNLTINQAEADQLFARLEPVPSS